LKTSSEDVHKELQLFGKTINAMNKETNIQNAQFREKISEKLTSIESYVNSSFKSLQNEQARTLKLTTVFIAILIIASTAISYFLWIR